MMIVDLTQETPPERRWQATLDSLFPRTHGRGAVQGAAQIPYLYGRDVSKLMNDPAHQQAAALAEACRQARGVLLRAMKDQQA